MSDQDGNGENGTTAGPPDDAESPVESAAANGERDAVTATDSEAVEKDGLPLTPQAEIYLRQLFDDIREMLAFAHQTGRKLPKEVAENAENLFTRIKVER